MLLRQLVEMSEAMMTYLVNSKPQGKSTEDSPGNGGQGLPEIPRLFSWLLSIACYRPTPSVTHLFTKYQATTPLPPVDSEQGLFLQIKHRKTKPRVCICSVIIKNPGEIWNLQFLSSFSLGLDRIRRLLNAQGQKKNSCFWEILQ